MGRSVNGRSFRLAYQTVSIRFTLNEEDLKDFANTQYPSMISTSSTPHMLVNPLLIQTLQEELRPSLINVTVDNKVPVFSHKVIIIGG